VWLWRWEMAAARVGGDEDDDDYFVLRFCGSSVNISASTPL
jgi:hypothetical protein